MGGWSSALSCSSRIRSAAALTRTWEALCMFEKICWRSTSNPKCHVTFLKNKNECQLTSTFSSEMSPQNHMLNSTCHFNFKCVKWHAVCLCKVLHVKRQSLQMFCQKYTLWVLHIMGMVLCWAGLGGSAMVFQDGMNVQFWSAAIILLAKLYPPPIVEYTLNFVISTFVMSHSLLYPKP
jgi:hypothetical protein